jgi:hypothetical protein
MDSTVSTSFALARNLLVDILNRHGAQVGARLKQLLSTDYEASTGSRFHEGALGFRKFSDFLAANNDILEVAPAEGRTDVSVTLRPAARIGPPPLRAIPGAQKVGSLPQRLPSALWQAFTNPDPTRRRFFQRTTHRVLHFAPGQTNEANLRAEQTVASDPGFVEVEYIPGDKQLKWMAEFLESTPLPPAQKSILEQFAKEPYTSASNQVFAQALGGFGSAWRRFRYGRVNELIRAWAERNDISAQDLYAAERQVMEAAEPRPVDPAPTVGGLPPKDYAELRRVLHAAVDALEGPELDRVLIPAGAIPRLLTAYRRGE